MGLLDQLIRYRKRSYVVAWIAVGLWGGWIAWMTQPGAIEPPAQNPAWCTCS